MFSRTPRYIRVKAKGGMWRAIDAADSIQACRHVGDRIHIIEDEAGTLAKRLDCVSRKVVTHLTIAIWIGVFVAGLWPFDFAPKNKVAWLRDGTGLQFKGYGQLYSSVPLFSPRALDRVVDASVELVFTPSKDFNEASTFFSLVNQDEVSFAIGQSITDLFLQGSFTGSLGAPLGELWIDDVCGHEQELFVTVNLDPRHIDVYLDGQLARSFAASTRIDNLSGKVFVGHSVNAGGKWSGSVARLAVLEGALKADEISRRYQQWARTRHLENDVYHRGVVYEFVRSAGEFESNVGDLRPDLIIPKTFRLAKPRVLVWPGHVDRSAALDAVVNIAGFVPFGLGTCLCLRFWTGRNILQSVAMTVLIGASVSLAIELLQVLLPTRDSSLADVVTNIMGTVIGAGAMLFGK